MRMQLSITLKYLIMNKLTVRERIYLSARERYNIIRKDDENDALNQIVFSFFRLFIFEIIFLLDF